MEHTRTVSGSRSQLHRSEKVIEKVNCSEDKFVINFYGETKQFHKVTDLLHFSESQNGRPINTPDKIIRKLVLHVQDKRGLFPPPFLRRHPTNSTDDPFQIFRTFL